MGLAQWRDFDQLQECELRNGRVAMLASVGWVWPQMFGTWDSSDVTSTDPIEAFFQVDPAAWAQIVILGGCFELAEANYKKTDMAKPFWDPMNLTPKDEANYKKTDMAKPFWDPMNL